MTVIFIEIAYVKEAIIRKLRIMTIETVYV